EPRWVQLQGSGSDGAWREQDDKLPQAFRAILTKPDPDVDWESLAADLYRQRLLRLEKHLQGIRHVIVKPSWSMAGIPIEALTDRYHVSYAPSGTLFAWLREKKQPPAAA